MCGDPWSASPREHEAPGGKFATGQIVRRYSAGSWIQVIVDITTNHGGFFIFKLCHNDDVTRDPGQECFESNILQTGKDGETELRVREELWGPVKMYVKLPDNLTCDQCIIQWTWIAANNWGSCHQGGRGMGCGPQETFRSCADIAITGKVPKTGLKKMEKLKKLYLLLKKREKEKSSLLTRLKLLKIKREMALKMNEMEQRDQRGLKFSQKEVKGQSRRNKRLTTQKNMETEQKITGNKMFDDYRLFGETKSYSGNKKTLSGLVLPWWMRIVVKV